MCCKNFNDLRKRDFAAEAASALSFWALGLRPVHRSGDVYSLATEATQSDPPTSTADPEVVQPLIDLVSLPVPMQNGDREFNEMMEAYQRDMQQSEISSSISSVVSSSYDLVTAVQPAARAQPVISSTFVSAFDDPAPVSLPSAEASSNHHGVRRPLFAQEEDEVFVMGSTLYTGDEGRSNPLGHNPRRTS